jgi:hypothetical protein
MIYNSEKKENSFQLGHAYVRFYPLNELLPIAPKAVLAQHLAYTYNERKPVTPIVAQAEMASGMHRLRTADFRTAGPFPVTSSSVAGVNKVLRATATEESTTDDEMPNLVDDRGSDMEVDEAENPFSALRHPTPPSPTTSTASNCGTDEEVSSQTTSSSSPSAKHIPASAITSVHVPYFPSKTTPGVRMLPGAFISIAELDRLIGRPAMGQPIFNQTKPLQEIEVGNFTTIFQIEEGEILHEHPNESLGRLQHAWRNLLDEFRYQVLEEISEGVHSEGKAPNAETRKVVARRFENPEACRNLTNRFRFRMMMSHILPSQQFLDQETFDHAEWLGENVFGRVPVTIAGRWRYRRVITIAIFRQLYRAMVFTTEYFLLRKVDHLFRARYAAYVHHPTALNRYLFSHSNRFLSDDQRRWLIVAWELLVYLEDVELSALVQYTLRIQFVDSKALNSLHQLSAMPRLPASLPGVVPMTWYDVLTRREDLATFYSHVTPSPNTPAIECSSINSHPGHTVSPPTLSTLLNPSSDTSTVSPSTTTTTAL